MKRNAKRLFVSLLALVLVFSQLTAQVSALETPADNAPATGNEAHQDAAVLDGKEESTENSAPATTNEAYQDTVILDGQEVSVEGSTSTTVTEHENGTTTDTEWNAEGTAEIGGGQVDIGVTGGKTETVDGEGNPVTEKGEETITGTGTTTETEETTESTPPRHLC